MTGHRMKMVSGRPTRIFKNTTRPDDLWPEIWELMTPKQKRLHLAKLKEKADAKDTSSASAAVARPLCTSVKRTMNHKVVEVCCRSDSAMGAEKYTARGAVVFRVTEKSDFTTAAGLNEALEFVRANPGCDVFGSLPCTAGCSWWRVNRSRGVGLEMLKIHRLKFRALIKNFVVLAREARLLGGDIHFEWPKTCDLWKDPEVQEMISEFQLEFGDCDGCSMGVVAQRKDARGLPIRKSWRVATSSAIMRDAVSENKCPGPEIHPFHARCEKSDTAKTGFYPPMFTDLIHNSIAEQTRNRLTSQTTRAALPVSPIGGSVLVSPDISGRTRKHPESTDISVDEGKLTDSADISVLSGGVVRQALDPEELSLEGDICENIQFWLRGTSRSDLDAKAPEHNPRQGPEALWNALITKTLHPSDPLSRCKEALDAVDAEVEALRSREVWDEPNVMEFAESVEKYPDADYADLFSIVGIKNFESQNKSDHRWKGRVVLGGHAVKKATGEKAIFTGSSSTPSTMEAARILVALKAVMPWLELLQSDCIRAYVQALMTGRKTLVRLPKRWWRSSWFSMKDPVCLLLRALYGHPKSGDIWHDKIDIILLSFNFVLVEGWPGVYIRGAGTADLIVFVLYVDDLVMLGGPSLTGLIKELQKVVEMEEPAPLNKYLGCSHSISTTGEKGSRITECEFDMQDYTLAAIDEYVKNTGLTLKSAPTPFAPVLPSDQLDVLLATKGRFGEHAASHLMKLMFEARMACPLLSVAIQRLACNITKWTAECDRRLHRIYCFLYGNSNLVLTGSLSEKDLEAIQVIGWPDADLNGDLMTSKSTSGFFLELAGLEGRGMPLSWGAKRQGSTSSHTCEAETVSLSSCLRTELIPVQHFLQVALGRAVPAKLMEDNSATIVACEKGYSPSLRHMPRTQRCGLGFINEVIQEPPSPLEGCISIEKVSTDEHRGDCFTKELVPAKFARAVELLRVRGKAAVKNSPAKL